MEISLEDEYLAIKLENLQQDSKGIKIADTLSEDEQKLLYLHEWLNPTISIEDLQHMTTTDDILKHFCYYLLL